MQQTTEGNQHNQSASDSKRLGELLAQMRQSKGFSQRKLAQLADLTNTAISSIEHGKSSPSITTLERILKELECDLADFFTAYQQPATPPPEHIVARDLLTDISTTDIKLLNITAQHPLPSLSMLIEEYPPHTETHTKALPHTEAVGTVTSGSITIIAGMNTYHLNSGDSYIFSTNTPRTFINSSDTPTTIISAYHNAAEQS